MKYIKTNKLIFYMKCHSANTVSHSNSSKEIEATLQQRPNATNPRFHHDEQYWRGLS